MGGVVAGILATVVVGILGSVAVHRQLTKNGSPKPKVHALRRWRPHAFSQALDYIGEYTNAHDSIASPRESQSDITAKDVYIWGCNLLLTAASHITRYSQGKANLFVVNEAQDNPAHITLRSQQFVGAFPLQQLTALRKNPSPEYTYRVMPVSENSATVAGKAVRHTRVHFDKIGEQASDLELKLGTTHILAIPLSTDVASLVPGDPAVITIDCRLPPRVRFLKTCRIWHPERALLARAAKLQEEARNFVQNNAASAS